MVLKQYMSLLFKLSGRLNTSVAVASCPIIVEPLLSAQVILPIPSGPDICCKSVMGKSRGMSLP